MTAKPVPEPLSKALAMLVVGHTVPAVAEHLHWPVGAVRKLALAQRGWLIGDDNRITCPGKVRITTVPDSVHREHLDWAQQLLENTPAPQPSRTVLPPTRRPGAAATRPEESPAPTAPRPVPEPTPVEPVATEPEVPAVLAGLIGSEPSTAPEPEATAPAAEEAPPAPSASAGVQKRPRVSAGVRKRPEPIAEATPEPPAEPAVDAPASATPEAQEDPTKRCPRCATFKPHGEFLVNRDMPDGLSIWCRACFRAVRS